MIVSREFLRAHLLGFSLVMLLSMVLFVKYSSYSTSDPIIYFYAIGVTTFELSRVGGSFFYRNKRQNKDTIYEPNISFVIPVKNEEKVIAETIRRCYDVVYPKEKLEVIIVNDGSTDNTWYEIEKMKKKHPQLNAINWTKNRGKRYAMAEGFRRARGDIIIQLDSDSFIEKSSLSRIIEPLKDQKIAAISAHTDPANKNENVLTKMQAAYYFMAFRALKAAESIFHVVFCCSGCCSAYRKRVVLPLLDAWTKEMFLSKPVSWGDDRSLTNLILKSGYSTVYSSDAQAYTIVPNNMRQYLKQQIRWKKSWFINSINASKFIFKRDKFVAITYFFPLMIITLVAPIIAFKALILNPLFFGISPLFYIMGVFLISALMTIHYKFFRGDGYWKYMFVWSFLNMTLLVYLLPYALLDMGNRGWGTR